MKPDCTPLRVLHVLGSGQVGGIERLVSDLCAEQSRSGDVIPSVIFTRSGGPFAEAIRAQGTEVIQLDTPRCAGLGPTSIARLIRAARANGVVHLHGFTPAVAFALAWSARPVLFHEHGVFGQGRSLNARDRLKRRLKSWFLRHCVAVTVANSHWTADQATTLYRLERTKLAVVHNGISTTGFRQGAGMSRRPTPSEDRPLVVGSVGRLVRFKRFDRLLQALALVPNKRCRGLIWGEGPDRAGLLETALSLGIADRVLLPGPTADVPTDLQQMDIFVLPSSDEPFGLVLVEALAAGLPAIVFADSGGPAEVLGMLGCGIVVADEAELAEVMGNAVESGVYPPLCTLEKIETEFDIAVMAQRFLGLYRKITHGEQLGYASR
jgi:glycosyltransferase involved in cell wall biosynthesis